MVDVMLPDAPTEPNKLRFGGIVHAARALWAIGCPYGMGYVAPTYLETPFQQFIAAYNAITAQQICTIEGSPMS